MPAYNTPCGQRLFSGPFTPVYLHLTLAMCLLIGLTLVQNRTKADTLANSTLIESLDPAAFSSWVDGQEGPVFGGGGVDSTPLTDGPKHIVWTTTTRPQWDGARYGVSTTPGPRYLRIAFNTSIPVGSVLVRGGGSLYVLKPGAAYPGNLASDSDWIPAWRIAGGAVTTAEVDRESYAVWTLPPGTITRALRFEHVPNTADSDDAGWIGGLSVLPVRLTNIAQMAHAFTSIDNDHASLINDGTNNGTWGAWDNGDQGDSQVVSPDHPNDVMLVWSKPVTLAGLCALWAGFSAGEVDMLTGDTNPRTSPESAWHEITPYSGFQNGYPLGLYPNWIDFGKTVTTRAVRLRITAGTQESHPHLNGKTYGGKRIWLGELMAIQPLANALLKTALPSDIAEVLPHPPIPVHFHLDKPGYVTLVIDDSHGVRIRNLVSETPYPAGDNVAWWDGLDDRGRDTDASSHAIYFVPGQLVQSGTYRVSGLVRQAIDLHYVMTANTNGHPAWQTQYPSSQWLANHTPPQSALYLPEAATALTPPGLTHGGQVLVGSYVTEGGSGLAWLKTDGGKLHGVGWIGGNWTGAPFLARDDGDSPLPNTYAYVGSAFDNELRLTELTKSGDSAALPAPYSMKKDVAIGDQLAGIAVRNGLIVASLGKDNQLLFVNAAQHSVLGTAAVLDPRGVAFDSQGRLLVLSGTSLLRYAFPTDPTKITAPETIISSGLDDPQGIAVDSAGQIYISNCGASQQVKVFSNGGVFIRAIGHAGAPTAGPYDQDHMNNPAGLCVDALGRVWVTENDFQPKRVSVWSNDGRLVEAYYGPPLYGGGGEVDPHDSSVFYYCGMKFHIDMATGKSWPVDVFYRPQDDDPYQSPSALSGPQKPIYIGGREYLTNAYNSNPTNGASVAAVWLLDKGVASAVAAMGVANNVDLLKTDAFKPDWPAGVDLKGDYWQNQAVFYWSDKNGDGKMEPDEVTISKQAGGGVTVLPDLSFVESRVNDNAVRFAPTGFSDSGVPNYDFAGKVILSGVNGPVSSGGDQALDGDKGWTIFTNAPKPFSAYGVGGAKDGVPLWSYPSLWPGLHASHNAPLADHPGELLGTTRLLGGFITPHGSDAGQLWAINGNFGSVYLLTTDGLFVATLLKDCRTASWSMPSDQKNMLVNDASEGSENFWPTITEEQDGTVYLTTLVSCILRVDGLDSIKRLPTSSLKITASDLKNAQLYFERKEALRQASVDQDTLSIPIQNTPPVLDGKLDDWANDQWATIDIRTDQIGDWGHSEAKVVGALAVSGDRLYAAFKTGDPHLLTNAGGALPLFKTGGALDIMIGAVDGGERLLVTQVAGKTTAILYRPHDPHPATQPVAFSSPLRTIKFDTVADVSGQVTLAGDGTGNYEFSIPLSVLGLNPLPGQTIKGDIGLLRGNGFDTLQRVYWRNKATGLVSDVPSEAELTPQLWGDWTFTRQ